MITKTLQKKIKAATVAMGVMNKEGSKKPFTILGSGFCIDPSGIVVTCQHVLSAFMSKSIPEQIEGINPAEKKKRVQRAEPIKVLEAYAIFYDTDALSQKLLVIPSKVDLMMAKSDYDLGMVRLLPHEHLPNGYPHIEIEEYGNIHEGQDVGLCGFPLGDYLYDQIGTVTSSFTKGIISSIIPSPGVNVDYLKGFQLDITATHGNSGGPVFSLNTGKVFGVLQRGIDDMKGNLFDGMVKAEPVYPILSHNSLEMIKNAQPGSLPNIEDHLENENQEERKTCKDI